MNIRTQGSDQIKILILNSTNMCLKPALFFNGGKVDCRLPTRYSIVGPNDNI